MGSFSFFSLSLSLLCTDNYVNYAIFIEIYIFLFYNILFYNVYFIIHRLNNSYSKIPLKFSKNRFNLKLNANIIYIYL